MNRMHTDAFSHTVNSGGESESVLEMITYRVGEADRDRIRQIWSQLENSDELLRFPGVRVRLLETSYGLPLNQRLVLLVEYPHHNERARRNGNRIAYALKRQFDAAIDRDLSYSESIQLHPAQCDVDAHADERGQLLQQAG